MALSQKQKTNVETVLENSLRHKFPGGKGAYLSLLDIFEQAEIIWNGIKIKVPPLNLQLNNNIVRGRNDRVEKIKKYLAEH